MHVWLLAGYAADALLQAARIVEIALQAPASTRLNPLDETNALGNSQLLAARCWLEERRRATEHLRGQIHADLDLDGHRARELAIHLAQSAGLVTEAELIAYQRSAAWHASEPASSALLRLDRASHRKALDDLLALPVRTLVVLVHGEVDQGHDHFAEVMTWRLHCAGRRCWREIAIRWPSPSRSLGTRLAMLLDDLARALGVRFAAPAADPTTPDGGRAWAPAVTSLVNAIDACRERVVVRHVVRCLSAGTGGDDALVDAYMRLVWSDIALRSGQRIVVGFDLGRIERGGFPMSKAWRIARTELAAARAFEKVLDRYHMVPGGLCIVLPELTSIRALDLTEWLRTEGGRRRHLAESEANQLVTSTRGGRFDLLLQRLIALNLNCERDTK